MARFRMKTATDIRRTLQRVSNMVLEGELDTKQANAIIYACNTTLTAIRANEDEAKQKEIEVLLLQVKERQDAIGNQSL